MRPNSYPRLPTMQRLDGALIKLSTVSVLEACLRVRRVILLMLITDEEYIGAICHSLAMSTYRFYIHSFSFYSITTLLPTFI